MRKSNILFEREDYNSSVLHSLFYPLVGHHFHFHFHSGFLSFSVIFLSLFFFFFGLCLFEEKIYSPFIYFFQKPDVALINKRKNIDRRYKKNSLHIGRQYGLSNQVWICGVRWDDEKKRNVQCLRMPKYVTQLKIMFRRSHTRHV